MGGPIDGDSFLCFLISFLLVSRFCGLRTKAPRGSC